jgi:hypothetical protein
MKKGIPSENFLRQKHLLRSLLALAGFIFSSSLSYGQLTGIKTIPGTYATLNLAIADLNAQGVGPGGVTFDIAAGYTETAPAGGYMITATGTASNPIIFEKSGAGANPLFTAQTGGTALSTTLTQLDGIVRFIGSDWVTLNGISLRENPSNVTVASLMEYGLAFYKSNGVNGCQHNTIQNCNITLNRNNLIAGATAEIEVGSCAIFFANSVYTAPSLAITVTASSGTNSDNHFYSNTIQNCNVGISMRGYTDNLSPFAFYDQSNDIGGVSPATGNSITNFGGGIPNLNASSNEATGIKIANGNATNISNNIVASIGGAAAHLGNVRGIANTSPNAALMIFNNNTISIRTGIFNTFISNVAAIDAAGGSLSAFSVINITNNLITNCITDSALSQGQTSPTVGIRITPTTAPTINVTGNQIFGDTIYNEGAYIAISYGGSNLNADVNITSNQVYNIYKWNGNPASGGGGSLTGITANFGKLNISGNQIHDFSIANIINGMTCTMNGINFSSQNNVTTLSIINNNIYNFSQTASSTSATSMTMTGINFAGNTGVQALNLFISGNLVHGFTCNATAATAGATMRGMEVSCGFNIKAFNNKIYDFTGNGAIVNNQGMRVLAGNNLDVYNNYIGNLFAPNSTAGASPEQAIGIIDESTNAGQNHNFYFNTIHLSGTSTGTNFGSSAIRTNNQPNVTFRNNLFINNTAPTGIGLAVAFRRAVVGVTTYMTASNNNIFYSGSPAANRLIFYDGTNSDQTLAAFKARVAGRDNASATESTPFLSLTGSSPNFLHVNTAIATAAESGGVNIAGITNDFDSDVRQGNVGYIGSGTNPDIGADEFGGIGSDLTAPAITTGTVIGACGTGDRNISGVIITDATGVPIVGSLVPRIYYKKNAGGSYFSQPGTLSSGNGNNGSWSFTIVAADMGGLTTADSVGFYFIAQDLAGTPNISSVPFGAAAIDVNTVSAHPATINYFKVLKSLSGTYLVGAGQIAPNYTTIEAAIADYNNSCLSGPVVFSLVDALYLPAVVPIVINANPYASATNTLTIKPASGNVSISASGSTTTIIGLLGADYVIIEGSASPVTNSVCPLVQSTRNLTISNSNSSGVNSSVIDIASNGFDGATNNIIRNCIIVGNSNTTATVAGIILGLGSVGGGFSAGTSSFGFGNNDNIIENDSIVKVQHGIISQGFNIAIKNQNNIFRMNAMTASGSNGIGRVGIMLGFENNALVTGNKISNITGSSSGADVIGISLGSTNNVQLTFTGNNEVTNSEISKNIIDSLQSFATITAQSAIGILLAAPTAGTSSSGSNLISDNMISRMMTNSNSTSECAAGIFIGNQIGSTTKIYNNTINMSARGFVNNISPNLCLYVAGNTVIPSLDIRNNIFSNTMSLGLQNNFVIAFQPQGLTGNYANLVSDNNDFFVSPAGGNYNTIGVTGFGTNPSINPGNRNFPTLAAWQAETGRDVNSKNVLPVFVAANDPHLVNNNAVNFNLNGTAFILASVPDDIDCDSRTGATSPDIGADEFTVPPVDIAFDAIKPTANTTCHGANESIIVTVRNTGSATIDMSTDPIAVSCTYSGTIAGTSTGTVSTGTLAANGTVDVILSPAINTTVNGSYTFLTTITPIAGESSATNNSNTSAFTITNTALSVTTNVFSDSICLGYSTPITASATGGSLPYNYSWSHGLGSASSVTAAPSTQTTYTVTVTDPCGNTATATAFVDVFIPGVQSVNPGSRCGVGSVALSAVPNPGSSLVWYNNPTGTAIAGTGNSFNTPSIGSSTNFYVSAASGNIPYYVGLPGTSPAFGAGLSFTNGATFRSGLYITATKPGAITGCTVYPSFITSTDVIRICLRARGSGVNIATAGPFTFSSGVAQAPVNLKFNLPIIAPGDYQIVYDTVSGTSLPAQIGLGQYSFSFTGTYPMYTADSSLIIVGGSSNNVGSFSTITIQSTSYSSFFNIEYTTYCESARVPVLASVTPPPALTISPNVNLCLNDTFPISVTSNLSNFDSYLWTPATNLYTNAACTTPYIIGTSATTVYTTRSTVGSQVYTLTANNTSTSCSNVATATVTAQPLLTSATSNTFGVCGSGTVTLSVLPSTGFGVGGLLWESSTDSINWSPMPGSTTTIVSPILFVKTYIRVSSVNSNNLVCSRINLNAINVNTPSINATTPGATCGVGPVTLQATPSAGATAVWYANATDLIPLASGSNYVTAPLGSTTPYYVEAQQGFSTNFIGLSDTLGVGTIGTTAANTLWLTVIKPGTIQYVTMYPTAAGTFNISLNPRGLATQLQVSANFTITGGQIGTAVEIPLNMILNTPGAYQLVFNGLSFRYVQSYNGSAPGYPFTNADGSMILVGTANSLTTVAALNTNFAPFFNIRYNTPCRSARQPVVATVNPVPPFTLNTQADTVCGFTPYMLTVTSTLGNFNKYTWTPATGLYTNPAGTIPYIAGTSAITVYANPLISTNYIATATDTIQGCVDTNIVRMTPIFVPVGTPTIATFTVLCSGGSSVLSIAGVVNSTLATYKWEQSPDSLTWSIIPLTPSTTYLTGPLLSTTYFRCGVYCKGSITGYSVPVKVGVFNPQILSTTDTTKCGPGVVTLHATATPGAAINWYNVASGGSSLATGNNFITPNLLSTTSFYVDATDGSFTEPAGLPIPPVAGGTTPFLGRGLRFNTTKLITINSVKVKSQDGNSGNIDIALWDNANNELASTGLVPYSATNATTISLSFVVPAGNNYQLVAKAGSGFLYTSFPVTYPIISASGAMTITGGQFGTNTPNAQYYHFYDIDISSNCFSPRVPVTANITPSPSISVTSNLNNICPGTTVNLSVASPNDPNYTYTWMPGGGTGANIAVTPLFNTTYTVFANDVSAGPSSGCQAQGFKSITVNSGVPPFTVNPPAIISCSAAANPLDILIPLASGSDTLGHDTLNANQFTNYPAPYGGFSESAKHQILITASELSASGMTNGSEITSLAFNVAILGASGMHNNFTLKLAPTNVSVLTSWITSGFTTVYGPVNYQPVAGSNVHTFSSSYLWDGFSNLVVEVCFSNDPTNSGVFNTANAVTHRTPTGGNSVIYANLDNVDICPATPAFILSNLRPNMILTYTKTLSYSWAPSTGLNTTTGNSVIASPAATTVYTVTATSLGGCTLTSTSNIMVTPPAHPYLFPGDTSLCTGDFLVIAARDSGVYAGGWPAGTTFDFGFGPQPDSTLFVNGPGVFSVNVILPPAMGGCQASTENAGIVFRDAPVLIANSQPVNCTPNSGYISTQIFLGSPPYRFIYYNAAGSIIRNVISSFSEDTLFNIAAGDYSVVVYDTVTSSYPPPSCKTDSTLISVIAMPCVTLNQVNVPCAYTSASITSTVSPGTPPYSYAWSNGATTAGLTGLVSGTYTVTVTDNLAYTATASITLSPLPGVVTVNGTIANPVCRGVASGTITLSVTGGVSPYSYLWTGGTTTQNRNSLANGTYTVTVTDVNGCTKTKTFTLTQPATNLIINTNKTLVRCFGLNSGAASVSPSGGTAPYTYSWNTFPIATTAAINSLLAGAYTCTVTDAIGCTKFTIILITEPPDIIAFQTQNNVTFPGGNNGSASVSVTGGTPGYTYSWNTVPVKTTASVTGLTAGTYKCTISDSKGCPKKVTFVITEPLAKQQVPGSGGTAEEWKVNAYPNPSSGMIMLSFSSNSEKQFRISLADMTGRIVFTKESTSETGLNEIMYDFTAQPKGVYFIRIISSDQSRTIRIVIQ